MTMAENLNTPENKEILRPARVLVLVPSKNEKTFQTPSNNIKKVFSTNGEMVNENEIRIKDGPKLYLETIHPRLSGYPEIESFDKIMVMGSAWLVSENEFEPGLLNFIKKVLAAKKPFLGVCYGAQMLAIALGGKVGKLGHQEKSDLRLRLTEAGKSHPLFKNLPDGIFVHENHEDCILEVPNALILANMGENTPIEAFALDNTLRACGLQFHPEKLLHDSNNDPDNLQAKIITNFLTQ